MVCSTQAVTNPAFSTVGAGGYDLVSYITRVWKIVEGRLYLNLDDTIKALWLKDIAGNIAKAETSWPAIVAKQPSELQS